MTMDQVEQMSVAKVAARATLLAASPIIYGLRLVGALGATTRSHPFTTDSGARWNDDDVVVRHEMGHVLLWYFHGHQIGKLQLRRASDGLLEGGVVLGARPGTSLTGLYLDAYTERLLAGEAAARIYLNQPEDKITLRRLKEERLVFGIRPKELVFLTDSHVVGSKTIHEDISKVLINASTYHPVLWRGWISRRLANTVAVLRSQWHVVEACSAKLVTRLPVRPGTSFQLDASLTRAMLKRAGATTRDRANSR